VPLLKSLIALLFVLLGIVFAVLNRELVSVDLFFTSLQASTGLMLLLVLLLGFLLGGLVVLTTMVWPIRRALQKAEKSVAKFEKAESEGNASP
jgi:lipopolysaccharide assembly protein A